MRIITERKLREFWSAASGPEGIRREKVFREWIFVVREADWSNFSDVRKTFNHCDVYGRCTIFDVGGNKYRVIAKVAFGIQAVFIRFVLNHEEYDKNNWQADCK